jgi:hypothetical protein
MFAPVITTAEQDILAMSVLGPCFAADRGFSQADGCLVIFGVAPKKRSPCGFVTAGKGRFAMVTLRFDEVNWCDAED